MRERVQTWEDAFAADDGHPRRFTVNLTGGEVFAWDLFLARDAESRELIKHGVVECWLVWVGRAWRRAAFFLFHNGTETVYTFTSGGWASDDRMVEDIYWAA
ncbi:hypothetical protein [Limnohabitans sp.]|uniref:hypothetical protein n=1 Tax=Limnohabitans sp. TaxID=1907725 RepID=UPI003340CC0F